MPLYQLFCLARPQLPKEKIAETIRRVGQSVFVQKGLILDMQHYGDRPLAKKVRQPGAAFNFAAMWQLTFVAAPATIKDLQNSLKLDEQVLRYVFLKQPQRPSYPSTYAGLWMPHDEGIHCVRNSGEGSVYIMGRCTIAAAATTPPPAAAAASAATILTACRLRAYWS
ncbi:hypothetical protein WJX84_006000 [Apatococcus fuscideae]|uniref:Ribosomal protein S6 n=1 Tax=Apatococcus fuscideae TaxID=2026836 RepID=A0AAW1RUW7_9CHLO